MKRILCISTIALLAVAGCVKKNDFNFKNLQVDNWQPDWALPILNSNLTLKNIVQSNTSVTEDAEGVYSLHYSGDLFEAKAADYIKIPNQNYNTPNIVQTVTIPTASFLGSVSQTTSNNFTYTDASGAQLAYLNMKSGNVSVTLNSTFKQNVTATITFPKALKGGTPLQLTTNINWPSTSSTVSVDLAGYNFDFTNGTGASGGTKNYLPYTISFTINGTGESLLAGDHINANIVMTDIQYSFIGGFLGAYNIPIPADTIDVAVFDNTLSANIFIRNPKINLAFKNSFGMNVAAKFDNLFGLTNTGVKVNMALSPINVAGATVAGQSVVSKYTIDSTNSTVQNLFNPAPNQVIYNGSVMVNGGGTGAVYNFVTDTSSIALTAAAELPAWFNIINFSLQDTTKLLLPEDTSVLQKAEFKMLMDNAFPLYGRIQLYFVDENYNVLDSLVPTAADIIAQAPVDAAGRVSGRTSQVTTFTMTHDHYNAMASKVRYALIRGQLKTSGTNSVKIQSSNNLIVKLAFRFTLNVSSTDL